MKPGCFLKILLAAMQLCVQWDVHWQYSYLLVLRYRASLEDMLHCLHISSKPAVFGWGKFKLPTHVEVEAIVTSSKLEKDNLFSSVEAMVVILL